MSHTKRCAGAALVAILPVAAVVAGAKPAQAQITVHCQTLYDLPTVVRQNGCYQLPVNRSTPMASGAAIDIQADEVVIDLGGNTLENTAGPDTRAVGIHALNRKSIVVRNGTIRGFRYGVLLAGSESIGHTVESLLVQNSRTAGITVAGISSLIWRNRVYETRSSGAYAVGISQAGSQTYVLANTVVSTEAGEAGGYAAGIDLTHGYKVQASGNRVAGVYGGDIDYGIRCGADFASHNRVWRAGTPYSDCSWMPYPSDPYPYPYPYPFSLEDEDGYPYPF